MKMYLECVLYFFHTLVTRLSISNYHSSTR